MYLDMIKNKENDKIISKLKKDLSLKESKIESISSELEGIQILYSLQNDLLNGFFLNIEGYKKIKALNLFDYDYYEKNYDYCLKIDPLLEYIYNGYLKGNNPNKNFNNDFYMNYYSEVKQSGLNPLVYFVLFGLDEGKLKFNENINPLKAINKNILSKQISNFNNFGLNSKKRTIPIIVSVTSFPERMHDIHFCLYSLLNQNFKPDKVILWLSEEEFPNLERDIPQNVLSLKKQGLSIRWCDNLVSYKKLLPALVEYPDSIIVTADDDIFYPKNWLKDLYVCHFNHPSDIIAHRCRKIKLSNNNIVDYDKWPLNYSSDSSFFNFATGAGGVLYPPNSLFHGVTDYNLAKELCPYADDIWFWAMSILNKTKIRTFNNSFIKLTYVNPARELNMIGEKTLFNYNRKIGNNVQFKNIFEYFSKINDILFE